MTGALRSSSRGAEPVTGEIGTLAPTGHPGPFDLRIEGGPCLPAVPIGGRDLDRTSRRVEVHGGEAEGSLQRAGRQSQALGAFVGDDLDRARPKAVVHDEHTVVGSHLLGPPPQR